MSKGSPRQPSTSVLQEPDAVEDTPTPDAALRIHLLGGFRVSVGGRSVENDRWRLRKARSIVKLLALAPGHRLHREQVLNALWPDLDPQAAANNLHQALHVARRALQPAGSTRSPFLRLDHEVLLLSAEADLWVDVDAFEAAVAEARRTREPGAYHTAADLYAGELLPEDPYEDWTVGRREGLRLVHRTLLIELAELHEARGERRAAIEMLQRVLVAEPADEEAHVALMRQLVATGRQRLALRQYDQLVDALWRELDVEPSAASRQLYETIAASESVQSTGPPAAVAPMPVATQVPLRHNLPFRLTSFVGRDRELDALVHAMTPNADGTTSPSRPPCRLLTLIGAGGCGKTRLALEAATTLTDAFTDGVWLVALAGIDNPRDLAPTVAAVLGVQDEAGRRLEDSIVATLRYRECLLVLDNCEHLIDACARFAEQLLTSCPSIRMLTTSREALRIDGEHVRRVLSLSLPDAGQPIEDVAASESVRLLLDRIRAREPDFALTGENVVAIADICRRLDGIPLAIELAAARIDDLTVHEIAAQLDDPLRVLTHGSRTSAPRQQTLQAALDWSYNLLPKPERRLFNRLSVFVGGWTAEACDAIGSTSAEGGEHVHDLLLQLVGKSLVLAESTDDAGVRFRMLEPIRQYALAQLQASGESETIRERHAALYRALAEAAYEPLNGPGQAVWITRLEREIGNLRAALSWLFAAADVGRCERIQAGLRLAGAIPRFWMTHAHLKEGREWLERGLALSHECAAIDAGVLAQAYLAAGYLARIQADFRRAEALLAAGLELTRATGDARRTGLILDFLGDVALFQGNYERALPLHEESLAVRRAAGDAWGVAMSLNSVATVQLELGALDQAERLLEESLEILQDLDDTRGRAISLSTLAQAVLEKAELDRAEALIRESIALFRALGNALDVALCLRPLGWIAAERGQAERAARLLGAAERHIRVAGGSDDAVGVARGQRHVAKARAALDDTRWLAAWSEGQTLSLDEVLCDASPD